VAGLTGMPPLRTIVCLAVSLFLIGHVICTPARGQALETAVKAAFVYRFLEFVQWPQESFQNAQSPITIAVAGDDEIAAELQRIVPGRLAQNRPLNVVTLRDDKDLGGAHVLFAGRVPDARFVHLLNAASQRSILSITDTTNGLERGAVINLVNVSDRVQFEISIQAATKARLVLSSRLLSLAIRLKKGALEISPAVAGAAQTPRRSMPSNLWPRLHAPLLTLTLTRSTQRICAHLCGDSIRLAAGAR
jgi:hypothetical protein